MKTQITSFVLDEHQVLDLKKLVDIDRRWMEFTHGHWRLRGLVIVAGEVLRSPWMKATEEPWLSLAYLRGLPSISEDGLDFRIEIEFEDGALPRQLLIGALNNEMPRGGYSTIESSLPITSGTIFRLSVLVGAGPQGKPEGDWLGITLFSLGDSAGASMRRAQTNAQWRLENEIAHFHSVYSSSFYKDRQVDRRFSGEGLVRSLPEGISRKVLPLNLLEKQLVKFVPKPEENVFSYASRMLGSILPIKPPDFAERLRRMHGSLDRPVRMLSLCAGEAAIEGSILEAANVPVNLCLLDINETLLQRATSKIPDCAQVDCVLGNANKLSGQLGQFDIINITSGLHHLVDLESVLGGIANSLNSGGEFWLIGEQVGLNGNRLYPEAREECNRLFGKWPESRRKNAGTSQTDDFMPDIDYSSACFEGIRSQEILPLLERYFLAEEVYLRNCFLWRLFNTAYAANFDINNPEDIARVREAVLAEVLHWACGGRGTELFGVYRGKQAELFSRLGS